MSERDKSNDGSLVPAGRRGLATIATANPLVSRGLVDLARKNAVSNYFRGLDWFKKSDYEKASAELDESIRLFSGIIRFTPSAFDYRHRGKAFCVKDLVAYCVEDSAAEGQEDWYKRAMRDFDEAIRIDPSNALAYIERGCALLWGSGSLTDAVNDFDEAIRIDPGNAGWRALRGMALLDADHALDHDDPAGDLDKAIEDFGAAIGPTPGARSDLLIVFTPSEGKDDTPFERDASGNPTLRAGVRVDLHKELVSAYMKRAEKWEEKRDFEKAIQSYDKAIGLDANNSYAYCQRGSAWMSKGNYDHAIEDFDNAIAKHSRDEFLASIFLASVHRSRGTARMRKGEYDRAIQDFNESIGLRPNDSTSYNNRGLSLASMKDYDNAIKDYDEAIRLDPNDSVIFRNRACAWEAKGFRDKAAQDFDKADRLERRRRTLPVPRTLRIDVPGVLSVLFMGRAVVLAETPGLVEITPITLSEAHAGLLSGKGRLQKLRDLNAPEVIIQIEIRILRRFENIWKHATDQPEDYAYEFKMGEEHFKVAEFEKAVASLSSLTQLERLDLTGCPMSDEGIAQLPHLSNLRAVILESCIGISDDGLAQLAVLHNLEWLVLTGCSITDRGLANLSALKNLQVLNIAGCDKITQSGLTALKAALPQCEISSEED